MAILGAALALVLAQEPPPAPASTGLELALRAIAAEVPLLGTLRLHVALTNRGSEEASVLPLVLDERALVVTLSLIGQDLSPPAVQVRRLSPDSLVAEHAGLARVALPAGESISTILELPALWPGRVRVAAQLGPAEGLVVSPSVEVNVTGQGTVMAEIATSEGVLRFPLDVRTAPNSALHVAMLARQGFYNGLTFHRVVPGRWIQGGCPYGLGAGGPGFSIPREPSQERKFERGVVALASYVEEDRAGSQFFVVLSDLPGVAPGSYTILGRIADAESLRALGALGGVEVDADSVPVGTVEIRSVQIKLSEATP